MPRKPLTELTARQREILKYIDTHQKENGYPPSLRDICKQFEFSSTNGARYHLHRLQRMGHLEVEPLKSRGVKRLRPGARVVPPDRVFPMPILGRIPAGPFNYASPDLREDELTVDPHYFGAHGDDPELFGLRVTGDSMIEAGINDGDIVVVRPQQTADSGDIVVARWEDEATVKQFRRWGDEAVLKPANPAYEDIQLPNRWGEDGEDVAILGIVVGLIRSM